MDTHSSPEARSAEGTGHPSGHAVRVGGRTWTVPDFLRALAAQLDDTPPHSVPFTSADLPALDAFLGAGLPALRAHDEHHTWLEYRLRPPSRPRHELYGELHTLVRELLDEGLLTHFYFVHKAQGIRVRFHVPPAHHAATAGKLEEVWRGWERTGLISGLRHAVYEPEQHLFGGPAAMRWVHGVFTADSLFWLGHLRHEEPPVPLWRVSLSMIRTLLAELGITEFEDRDVWDRLRWQAGRTFGSEEPAGWARTSARINQVWNASDFLNSPRSWPQVGEDLTRFRDAVGRVCAAWRAEHLERPGALVGPREAAAFLVVFHWNRARMPRDWQVGITEALAQGPSEEVVRATRTTG
ncbi:hypothetical protein C1701_26065 [Actinoalloteichus sp. AHMU CJ021]|uniref:Thiopeptide-type bacteriocin biosynthesis domain-containing protein n=1 Tax=Actinoalloteichus caeruleus DSM 43889 TaxID=1120930 RepID=A0ABT1JER9_ACTCY|nr:thiopeptide-type bacteriocin biosynthesis protein [Actinoalloteichus caeruleus]AUS81218.1 hypothetical protein C1701_26065 [Actinoalloteichus sp. AHMU CJ021]MCP2330997.1 thiopeptide-type bacteriocin biosynthesis domain-containing protein [Actinoalloteichus caeruleus DSM 43889]